MKRDPVHDSPDAATLTGLARRLARTRGELLDRWLAATSAPCAHVDPQADAVLNGYFACMLAEVCAALLVAARDASLALNVKSAQPNRIWPAEWCVGDLFRNIESLQRCMKDEIRAYFGPVAATVDVHMLSHEIVERTFRAIIESAIEAQAQRQAAQVSAAQGSLHRALTALKATEERLRVATSAAGIGIFEWCGASRSGVWENRQMYEITGQPEEHGPLSEAEFMTSVVHPSDAELLTSHFQSRMISGEPVHVAFRLHRVNDRALRTVEMFGYLRARAQQNDYAFIGSLCDVTERAEAESKLRDADRRKDIFLATLAHELRNPLTPVRNAAHLLGHGAGADPGKREWLRGVIERQTRHLSHLIDDLLDVSRITTGKIKLRCEVFDIRKALEHALEIATAAAQHRHHDIVCVPLDQPAYINGDVARITQTLSNLLDNAIKYTDDGGRITVSASVVGAEVRVSVSDTGMGITEGALPHVFDLFVQGSSHGEQSRGGLGIGLSVCKTLVDMHGGTIVARSEGRNKGSEFEIRLPVCNGGNARFADATDATQRPSARLRVLIVDDNADAALSLAMILDEHEVRTAHSGEEALEIAAAFEPRVIFLDLGLPGISGYEVARRLKAHRTADKPMEIIAVSGYGQPEDIARSSLAGCDGHLVKPVDIEQLLAVIARISGEGEFDYMQVAVP